MSVATPCSTTPRSCMSSVPRTRRPISRRRISGLGQKARSHVVAMDLAAVRAAPGRGGRFPTRRPFSAHDESPLPDARPARRRGGAPATAAARRSAGQKTPVSRRWPGFATEGEAMGGRIRHAGNRRGGNILEGGGPGSRRRKAATLRCKPQHPAPDKIQHCCTTSAFQCTACGSNPAHGRWLWRQREASNALAVVCAGGRPG